MFEIYEVKDDIENDTDLEEYRNKEETRYGAEISIKGKSDDDWFPIGNWEDYEHMCYIIGYWGGIEVLGTGYRFWTYMRGIKKVKIQKKGFGYVINNGTLRIHPKVYEEIILTPREVRVIGRKYFREQIFPTNIEKFKKMKYRPSKNRRKRIGKNRKNKKNDS